MLTDRAIEIVAEDKIRAAIAAGDFDALPGFGKPHPIFDEPYDEHWWIRRKLAREKMSVMWPGASAIT
ncbi:MAG: DUF1992 domain-containing protein [Planctomycetia bacterium]|nr:DUF1992 domain-containing protein [Planctomycetia bacterium]